MLSENTIRVYKMEIAQFKSDIKRLKKEALRDGCAENHLSIGFCESQIRIREQEMGA